MALRFFFYGTLLYGSDNPEARAAHAVLRPLGEARVDGLLYAIADPLGWYPALLAGAGTVTGHLYEATSQFGPEDLARMDAYEDFMVDAPEASLYNRGTIMARPAESPPVTAQAYFYAGALPGNAMPIADGDFRHWLAKAGYGAFASQRRS